MPIATFQRDDKGFAHPERIEKLVKNYSQFVSFPIYTWQEKGFTKEVWQFNPDLFSLMALSMMILLLLSKLHHPVDFILVLTSVVNEFCSHSRWKLRRIQRKLKRMQRRLKRMIKMGRLR